MRKIIIYRENDYLNQLVKSLNIPQDVEIITFPAKMGYLEMCQELEQREAGADIHEEKHIVSDYSCGDLFFGKKNIRFRQGGDGEHCIEYIAGVARVAMDINNQVFLLEPSIADYARVRVGHEISDSEEIEFWVSELHKLGVKANVLKSVAEIAQLPLGSVLVAHHHAIEGDENPEGVVYFDVFSSCQKSTTANKEEIEAFFV